ncbi:hypothetical protein PGB90_006358 [Kerria lacca]
MLSNVYVILLVHCIANAVPIHKFYPFGTKYGDHQLPKYIQEVSSAENILKVPIKFYGENYTSIYVNANGLLSFLTPLPIFINIQFPLDYPVIAALYANTDIRTNGSVYYRESQNDVLLARASGEIQQLFPNNYFLPKSLFIATWFQVGYYDHKSDKVNTFQVVVASNETDSYVEFLYADDGIQWLQGDGQPGTGLPDAKAQAGFVAYNGRIRLLQGSGTDQIRNLMRLSNTNEEGLWIFRVGDIGLEANVESPNVRQIPLEQVHYLTRESSCASGFSSCHSQATCIDTTKKFCCVCRKGYYGNGFNCLKEGHPLRASGKVNIDVNGIQINQQDLQAYIVVADGRSYIAISKVPVIGISFQLLYPITTMLNWLFAIPTGTGLNGFQITGGVLNHSAEIIYKETNDRVSVMQRYYGLDVFDQLKLEMQISGRIPPYEFENKLVINDYQTQFNFIASGVFRSSSSSITYKMISPSTKEEIDRQISLEQTITFNESCSLEYNVLIENMPDQKRQFSYYRVKTARNFVSYEENENILRFAATNKVSLLTGEEYFHILFHEYLKSSCVVEGDSFRCLCNPGFQTTYSNRYKEIGSNDFGCLDVNECIESKANCHENAICVNEIGSYQCLCKPGYSGNGYQCSETVSSCERDSSLCNPPNSYCANISDYRTCNCNHGFQKKYVDEKRIGFICVDINECDTDVCGANENCINLEGSYICECKFGTPGSGRSCKQCKSISVSCGETHNCSPNGECIYNDITGKYICRCIRGYYGDGYSCKTYGGRHVVPRICTADTCVCPPNFIGIDNLCIDNSSFIRLKNASVTCNTLPSMCHPRAQCIYNANTTEYQCTCNVGYEGNGLDCVESEISCLKNDICDLHAVCKTDERSSKAHCICNNHYHGDGLHCEYAGTCSTDTDCDLNEECYYNDDTFGYECRCRNRFVKESNGICRPVKVCPLCHRHARCAIDNATKDGFCVCLISYEGDGINTCEKILPTCDVEYNCSPYGKCEFQQSLGKFECRCKPGFVGNGTYCYDKRTCVEAPELCDRNARCVAGNYRSLPKCECNTGFIGDGSSCSKIQKYDGGFLFVNCGMMTLKVPYEPSISNSGQIIQLQANQIATGLALDCILGNIYWCDYIGQKIKSSTFKGQNISVVVEDNISAAEGITVDWIQRVLYWTDSGKKTIEAINLNGKERRTIISNDLLNPRGIAVHSYKRKLFWSDWNRAHPKIEWSNTDGTGRTIFLSGSDVQLPNSVTIDWFTDELCWADAGTKRIMCASIENKQSRIITDNCIFPFGLSVSVDKYYWTDWVLGKVGYYDKRTGKVGNLTLPLTVGGTLYGIVNVPSECP